MLIVLGFIALFVASCVVVALHWERTGYGHDISERGLVYKIFAFFGLCLIHPVNTYRDGKHGAQRVKTRQKSEEAAAEEERQKKQILESEKELVLLGIKEAYLAKLKPTDRQILEQLTEWPIVDLLTFKLKQTGLFEGRYDIWKHCVTYKRFMFFKGRPINNQYNSENIKAMYSPKVDMVWHTHILYTKDYKNFCNEVFGEYIHHTPSDQIDFSESTEEMILWLDEFIQAFGEVPEDLDSRRYSSIQCG